jgi:hypothetical protein
MVSRSRQVSGRPDFAAADILAHNYRISCEVYVGVQPLPELLNDPSSDFVTVENVYVSSAHRPAQIIASHKHGVLSKDSIAMAIVTREQDGRPTADAYGSYYGRSQYRVFITVPGFEVQGILETGPKMNPRTYLANMAPPFIPVFRGVASVSLNPDIRFESGVILVNKGLVGALCLTEES